MFARALGATALLLLFVSPAPAAIITNGSFETGMNPGVFTTVNAPNNNSAIAGWNVSNGSIDYIGTYWTASDGARSVDLNGLSKGTLSQTFATTAGATYQVTFDLAGNTDNAPIIKTLTASAGAFSGMFQFDTTGKSGTNMGWQTQSFLFTATGPSTTLTFTSTTSGGTPADAFGPALDNVTVTAIPEPATLAVMGFGLVGLVGYVRRRKLAQAAA